MGGETLGVPNWFPAQPLSLCQLTGLCPIGQLDRFSAPTVPWPTVVPVAIKLAQLARAASLIGLLSSIATAKSDVDECHTPNTVHPGSCQGRGGGEECILKEWQSTGERGVNACTYWCPMSGTEFTIKQVGMCEDTVFLEH